MERHPDFAGALHTFDPAEREAALAALAAQRPLYRAEALSVPLPGFDEQPEGAPGANRTTTSRQSSCRARRNGP